VWWRPGVTDKWRWWCVCKRHQLSVSTLDSLLNGSCDRSVNVLKSWSWSLARRLSSFNVFTLLVVNNNTVGCFLHALDLLWIVYFSFFNFILCTVITTDCRHRYQITCDTDCSCSTVVLSRQSEKVVRRWKLNVKEVYRTCLE